MKLEQNIIRLENQKNNIRIAYERYCGERKDAPATIKDVAGYFNIPIDETRLDDYQIISIYYGNDPSKDISIEIKDRKTNITYKARYTNKIIEYCLTASDNIYNILTEKAPNYTINKSYAINEENPIAESMMFHNGDYSITFERKYKNYLNSSNHRGGRLSIIYGIDVEDNGKKYNQPLLIRTYMDNSSDTFDKDCFERTDTYGFGSKHINKKNRHNKYSFILDNKIIYCVDDLFIKSNEASLSGYCIEETFKSINDYIPQKMGGIIESPNDDISVIEFTGRSGGKYHRLIILKNNSNISICYDKHTETIPIIKDGSITSQEIQNIILYLQMKYPEDEFIGLVIPELTTFGNKIDIRNGDTEEDLDMLNPKLHINRPFEEIAHLVSDNEEDCFRLMSEMFGDVSGIRDKKELLKVKK